MHVSRRSVFRQLAIILGAVFLLSSSFPAGQSVDYGGYRPHYQGYGVNTPGGRRGTVHRVTNLSDSGPGSLRNAVTSTGPRFVLFEVSGTIRLLTPLIVDQPFVTIAGQTAPSPGITLRGPGLVIDTHDVVVQHLRVRVGNIPNAPIALALRDDATNVVVDHVSVSWSVWTSLTVGANRPGHPTGEVTIIDSLVAEALGCSGVNANVRCDPATYPKDGGSSNSRGVLIGDGWNHPAPKVALIRNISANNNDRHPEVVGRTHTILVNNLIYNPSLTPLSGIVYHDAFARGPTLSVVQGNLMIPGPTTPGHNGYVAKEYPEEGEVNMIRIHPSIDPASRIYLEGNYYGRHCGDGACLTNPAAQWALAADSRWAWGDLNIRATTPPLELTNLPLSSAMPYSAVEEHLQANAGARPLDRDAVDARIIHEITTRTGSVPNRTSEKAGPGTAADGFPVLAQNRRRLTVPVNPHDVVDAVGRTRIEAWLEGFASALEPGSRRFAVPRSPG